MDVRLVISDAHKGLLRSASLQVFAEATWQRCKMHLLRNVASAVPSCTRRWCLRW